MNRKIGNSQSKLLLTNTNNKTFPDSLERVNTMYFFNLI